MLERPVVIHDNALRRTSAWANTFLGRDHTRQPCPGQERRKDVNEHRPLRTSS